MDERGDIGHIYVLSNPALGGIVKIGHTKKGEPEERARELSKSTSIPLPFAVGASWLVENPSHWESRIHARLAFSRVSKDREFFRLELSEAQAHINKLVYGTADPGEAVMRELAGLLDLYRRFPANFTNADSGLVLKVEQLLAAKEGDLPVGSAPPPCTQKL